MIVLLYRSTQDLVRIWSHPGPMQIRLSPNFGLVFPCQSCAATRVLDTKSAACCGNARLVFLIHLVSPKFLLISSGIAGGLSKKTLPQDEIPTSQVVHHHAPPVAVCKVLPKEYSYFSSDSTPNSALLQKSRIHFSGLFTGFSTHCDTNIPLQRRRQRGDGEQGLQIHDCGEYIRSSLAFSLGRSMSFVANLAKAFFATCRTWQLQAVGIFQVAFALGIPRFANHHSTLALGLLSHAHNGIITQTLTQKLTKRNDLPRQALDGKPTAASVTMSGISQYSAFPSFNSK